MTALRGRRAALRRLLVVAVFVLGGLFFAAAPASAHAILEKSTPGPGDIVQQAPAQIVLDWSENVDLSLGSAAVVGPDGKTVNTGKPDQRKGGREVVIKLPGGLAQGTYLVSYRVISADSHPVSGGYTFSIGKPSANPPTLASGEAATGGSGAAHIDQVVGSLYAFARYAAFVGLVLLIGPALLLTVLWPRRLSREQPRRLVRLGWLLVLGGTLAGLLLQAPYAAGTGLGGITLTRLVDVLSSRFGTAHLVRLALLVCAAPLLRRLLTGPKPTRIDAIAAGVGAVALTATWPWAGHATTSTAPLLSVPSDTLHLLSMSVWIGGLIVLARYLLPAANGRELRLLLPEWSRWAMSAVVVLIVTGTVQTVLEVGGWFGLVDSTYGRLILIKILLLAIILGVAATARSWVRRQYVVPVAYAATSDAVETSQSPTADEQPPASLERLRRGVMIEATLAAIVIAVAAVLVQTTPGRAAEATSTAQTAGGPFSATLRQGNVVIQVDLTPGQTGPNEIHLYAYTPVGKPLTVVEWKVTASLASKRLSNVDIPVQPITANHAIGQAVLPAAGNWSLSVSARTSDIDETTVQRTIPIA